MTLFVGSSNARLWKVEITHLAVEKVLWMSWKDVMILSL